MKPKKKTDWETIIIYAVLSMVAIAVGTIFVFAIKAANITVTVRGCFIKSLLY